jgi:hypothetical protein
MQSFSNLEKELLNMWRSDGGDVTGDDGCRLGGCTCRNLKRHLKFKGAILKKNSAQTQNLKSSIGAAQQKAACQGICDVND